MSPTNPFKVAILGAGGWGKNHVRTFCALLGAESVVVVDPDMSRREAMLADHPGIRAAEQAPWAEIDAAVIAAPAVLHYELAIEALGHGKHVLVEKPITLTSDEARDLIARAEENQRVLMVDHLLEYHPAVTRLKELIDEGRLGRLLHMTSRRLNLGVIRTEENALWSLAPHDISIILYLMGKQPTEVTALAGTYLQSGISDLAHVTLRFGEGELAHVHVSWLDPIKSRQLAVVGDRAMAIYDDMADEKLVLLEQRAVQQAGRYVPTKGETRAVPLEPAEPLRIVARTFLQSIEEGKPPRADGWDGLRVVRVLEAAQASIDTGGQPIRLEDLA
jgi:predicted dehydrogenase